MNALISLNNSIAAQQKEEIHGLNYNYNHYNLPFSHVMITVMILGEHMLYNRTLECQEGLVFLWWFSSVTLQYVLKEQHVTPMLFYTEVISTCAPLFFNFQSFCKKARRVVRPLLF